MTLHGGLSTQYLEAQEIAPGSGSANVNGGGADMKGWDGIAFYLNVGAITGLGTYSGYVVSAVDSAFTSPTNVSDSLATTNAALPATLNTPNTVAVVEVWRPTQRFVRFNLVVATNTVAYAVQSMRYRRSGLLPPVGASTTRVVIRQN